MSKYRELFVTACILVLVIVICFVFFRELAVGLVVALIIFPTTQDLVHQILSNLTLHK
ncbi:hypothetical protein I568_00106 [Enterococcus columbae DSM 7374 = ATCC 51263]|uniref:Uncharacterized protein n=1 Tax=Enterococcus columbae DSM 7374 = ATCC 51263 TaxID=1121865 RepID=S1NFJ6_9ENTE|nr:hypothetical protein OMW_02169 [Enterococcus columbae DSM 7374 = ATCC 51263]EOW87820.1 hypothetical protein I568_00106 [Enterococcus columbae DSM 7374 = ATCC 51263]